MSKEYAGLDSITIRDIFDKKFLQEIQDYFAEALGVASIAVDLEGEPITTPSNFSEFCMDLTRKSQEGARRCMECDRMGGEESAKNGKPSIYSCHAGLFDFAAPIMLNDKQIGTFLGGQVLTEKPDEDKFRKIAEEIDVDPDKYIEALRKIPVVPRYRIEAGANLLFSMCQNIAKIGYQSLLIKDTVNKVNVNIESISSTSETIVASSVTVFNTQESLNREISNIKSLANEIENLLSLINDISKRTKLLGLNASIEAARANEAGKGFSVVAKEIENLSNQAKDTVEQTAQFTEKIKNVIISTSELGESNLKLSQNQISDNENISKNIQDTVNIVNKLVSLTE